MELRTSGSEIKTNGKMKITGYAVVFDKMSKPMPFIEIIKPTAFLGVDLSQTLLLYNHDFSAILARADSNTLQMTIDEKGLFFEAELPDTQLGHDTYTNIENGNLKGLSFGFFVAKNGDTWLSKDSQDYHIINQIERLNEISLTAIPSYDGTSVNVSDETQRSYNKFLKVGGTKMQTDLEPKKKIDNSKNDNQDETKEPADSKSTAKKDESASDSKGENLAINKLATLIDEATTLFQKFVSKAEQADPDKDKEEGKKQDMSKNLTEINQKDQETRSFEQYIKSHGEQRAAVTTADNEAVVPTQILNAVKEAPNPNDLYQYVTRITISAPKGTLPVLKRSGVGLVTKKEAEKNPELGMQITPIDYAVQTYAGSLPITQEMIDDSEIDISALAGGYVRDVTRLTEQRKIGEVLTTTVKKKDVASADDLKTAYNKDIPAGYTKSFVLTQSAFDIVDHYKDENGRYLLQDNIAAPSGKSLLGSPVIVVDDEILKTSAKDNAIHGWVGDLKSFVLDAVKKESTIKWQDNDLYTQKLATYLRIDVVKAIEEAGELLTFSAPVVANA